MLACVIHNTLNSVGGGERVALETIRVLKSLGFKVRLYTTERTNWSYVRKMIGDNITSPDEELSLLPFRLNMFGIYMRLAAIFKMLGSIHDCDLTINTHGDVIPVATDVIYMHFPTFALLEYTPVNAKYSQSVFWRVYFEPYRLIQKILARSIKSSLVLTNSRYSAYVIRKVLGITPLIVYPPVDIDDFIIGDEVEREPIVVACGRLTPEKKFEDVILLASKAKREGVNIKFVIVGAVSGKVSESYLSKLLKMRDKLNATNLEIKPNLPRREQIRLYHRAMIYIHPMRGEHFGIAVVEAMAAGLVPIVHASGGPWTDIVEFGKWGFGYRTIDEAFDLILKAIEKYEALSKLAMQRSKFFDRKMFYLRMKTVVEHIMKVNIAK